MLVGTDEYWWIGIGTGGYIWEQMGTCGYIIMGTDGTNSTHGYIWYRLVLVCTDGTDGY